MIITVTLNPALDKTVILPGFTINNVNRVQSIRLDPGGKGINVSKTVQALGGETLAVAVLGGSSGEFIQRRLNKIGLPNDMVFTHATTRTNLKIVDPVLRTNTDINESGEPISQETLAAVWAKLDAAAKAGDTVVFAGKNPPAMGDDVLAGWIRQLRGRGVRICVDTVGEPMRLALAEKPHIIKPNKDELAEIVGRPTERPGEILDAARQLVAGGIELVTVSMGGEGALFVTKDLVLRGYSPKVKVNSTVGAGDSMMASLALYTEAGCALEEVARRAIAVSSATVMCDGTQAAQMSQILPLIDRVRIERIV